ncbi:MAG TPA: OmpA family protein [Hyphomonadaceae bacterium]|jgi:outer membrane protein OmpA-like peptidoglycan-associated protein|nr:OmpA family protein [Hyphomonadaceae bacterium]
MKNALKTTAAIAALTFTLAGCMSTPAPDPRLAAAEMSLSQAKSDPATFEAGRAVLGKADVSLAEARGFYAKGKTDDYTHAIRMTESYVALATARGDQVDANRKIETLNKDRADFVAQSRTRQLTAAKAETADAKADAAQANASADQAQVSADQARVVAANAVADSAAADTARLAAEARATALLATLASYEQKKTDMGTMLILRDLQFASSSSVLGNGAQGRLAPLADFLAKQPEAKIQIAGHTDSQGSDDFNMDLSARRAQSVGAYLISTGINPNRISSVGRGETAPTATNDTAAGRAINRRVEVTILN